jgi:hypothetical protein
MIELLDRQLSHWTITDTGFDNFRIAGDILEVSEPEGWLKSQRRYADFELEVAFRYLTDDADSGIFVRVGGERAFRRGWPVHSYQVQLRNPDGPSPYPPVGALFRHGMAHGRTDYDETLARAVSQAAGVWQTLGVRLAADQLSVTLNGAEITRAWHVLNSPGFIGIQGETGRLEFRSLQLRELTGGR